MRLAYETVSTPRRKAVYIYITHAAPATMFTARQAILSQFTEMDAAIVAEKARIQTAHGITLADSYPEVWAGVTSLGNLNQQWTAEPIEFGTQEELDNFVQSLVEYGYVRW